jgi:hypothetical protein
MSKIPFEARGYWHLEEVLDAVTTTPKERRRVRDWLTAANAVVETPTRGKVVPRVRLEGKLWFLLDTMRRVAQLQEQQDTPDDAGQHQ